MTPIAQIHPSAGWRSVSIPVVRSVWRRFKVEMGSDCYELTLVVEVTIGLVSTTPVEVGADSKSMRGTIRSAT
jgi:hypothetical protein